MKKLIVNKKYDSKKLNKFILDSLPALSINTYYKLLRKKDIKINGKRINKDVEIYEGDEILVYVPDDALKISIEIKKVYEDENILVVDKPASLEVTGENSLTTIVHDMYKEHEYKPMPCHRIDRNTTGLVLFAKNEDALNILFEKFKKHEIKKTYRALVYGIPKIESQTLEAYLFKDSKKSIVYISNEPQKGYQKIITSYSVIKKYKNNTALLEVQIETGRTHQIRAHLAHIGYPIVGDGKYGVNEINKELGYKYQQLESYKIKFAFKDDAGKLNYLNNIEIVL